MKTNWMSQAHLYTIAWRGASSFTLTGVLWYCLDKYFSQASKWLEFNQYQCCSRWMKIHISNIVLYYFEFISAAFWDCWWLLLLMMMMLMLLLFLGFLLMPFTLLLCINIQQQHSCAVAVLCCVVLCASMKVLSTKTKNCKTKSQTCLANCRKCTYIFRLVIRVSNKRHKSASGFCFSIFSIPLIAFQP